MTTIPTRDTPSFCYIAPTAYLDECASRSKTHLALAHLVESVPKYAEFYRRKSDEGDFVMMDNSAYELKVPYNPDKLVSLGQSINADAIVLPDFPFQPSAVTVNAAEDFIPVFKRAGFQTFFVPQSERGNLDDWIESYVWAVDNPDIDIIGMSILGIPNALPDVAPSFARVVMTQLLIGYGVFDFGKHHHFLGLNSGPALEIPSLINMGALTTIDSSGPVWTALLGHEYTTNSDSYLSVSKPTMPVDFALPMTKNVDTLKRIQHNIELTQQLFNVSRTNQNKVWYAQE